MSGLREIFFKPKTDPNIMVNQFVTIDPLVDRIFKKEVVKSTEVKDLIDLCNKFKRDDLVKRLDPLYLEALDNELEDSCQKQMKINKPTLDQ